MESVTPPKGSRPWTPGPWEISPAGDGTQIKGTYGSPASDTSWLYPATATPGPHAKANAERIVACVNALEPFDDPEDVGRLVRAAEALLELIPSWGKPEYEAAVDDLADILGRAGKGRA